MRLYLKPPTTAHQRDMKFEPHDYYRYAFALISRRLVNFATYARDDAYRAAYCMKEPQRVLPKA